MADESGIAIDPRQWSEIVFKTDIALNYAAFHWFCMKEHETDPFTRLDHLGRYGYEQCEMFDPAFAKSLIVGKDMEAKEFGYERTREILTPLFDRMYSKCRAYFGCEFAVVFFGLYGSGEDNASLKWHCDAGPRTHLKLLVYLNESDGATEFLDKPSTELFKRVGYGFGPSTMRTNDLRTVAGMFDIPFNPVRLSPPPGSGVVFEPTNALHRGVYPKTGKRWILQIGLMPWFKRWDDDLNEVFPMVAQNHSAGFPPLKIQFE